MNTYKKHKQILELWNSNLTKMEIAKKLNMPWNSVHYVIDKYHSLENFIEKSVRENYLVSNYELIINHYVNDKISIKQIMKITGITRNHINEILHRNNIQITSSSDRAIEKSLLGTNLNFFNLMDEHASYVLGVILGDGCVHHNQKTGEYYVNVTSEDRDILESVNIYFGGQFKIKTIKNSRALGLNIYSKGLTELMFQKFGLRGKKAHNLPWINLPQDMYRYMLLGLHSTDGSNYLQRENKHQKTKTYSYSRLEWNYTSVCFDFITKIKQYIENELLDIKIYLKKRTHPKGNISYSLRARGKHAIRLCDWMYKDTSNLTRCERKYQIFLPWKNRELPYIKL